MTAGGNVISWEAVDNTLLEALARQANIGISGCFGVNSETDYESNEYELAEQLYAQMMGWC